MVGVRKAWPPTIVTISNGYETKNVVVPVAMVILVPRVQEPRKRGF